MQAVEKEKQGQWSETSTSDPFWPRTAVADEDECAGRERPGKNIEVTPLGDEILDLFTTFSMEDDVDQLVSVLEVCYCAVSTSSNLTNEGGGGCAISHNTT